MKLSIIGVIPSRYASQRLPAKALVDLLGKTMVQRVYEQAKLAKSLDRVVVATDDTRIESVVKAFGGEVVMTSPDIPSGSDRVAAVAQKVKGDIFVNIQGDEPLVVPELIDEAVKALINDPEAVVGTAAKLIRSPEELANPAVVKVVFDRNHHALYFSRSVIPHVRDKQHQADWPAAAAIYKHIGIYVFRREFLLKFSVMGESPLEKAEKLEQLRVLEAGQKIVVAITDHDSIPIDTLEDVERVLKVLKSSPSQHLPKDSLHGS
ncbi:MAG: 3-deoxy-manno-octulosonate cytidylyltransferase [Bacteroidota bacterium]